MIKIAKDSFSYFFKEEFELAMKTFEWFFFHIAFDSLLPLKHAIAKHSLICFYVASALNYAK